MPSIDSTMLLLGMIPAMTLVSGVVVYKISVKSVSDEGKVTTKNLWTIGTYIGMTLMMTGLLCLGLVFSWSIRSKAWIAMMCISVLFIALGIYIPELGTLGIVDSVKVTDAIKYSFLAMLILGYIGVGFVMISTKQPKRPVSVITPLIGIIALVASFLVGTQELTSYNYGSSALATLGWSAFCFTNSLV